MMKKNRTLAMLLCVLMLLSAIPFAPASFSAVITAYAANTTSLQALYDSVPPKSKWSTLYFDTAALSQAYDNAAKILAAPDKYDQDNVNMAESNLRSAINNLRYHTTGIEIKQRSITANVGETVSLTVTLQPANAADAVSWSSSNSAAASVSSTGVVTVKAYSAAAVRITASSNGFSSTCNITIKNPLNAVKLSKTSASAYKGQSFALEATAVGIDTAGPVTDTIDSVTWTTSNSAVATVSSTGVVDVHGEGNCTISATMKAGARSASAGCALTVNRIIEITELKPITVSAGGTLTIAEGGSETVRVSIVPATASIQELNWTVADSGVARVVSSGVENAEAFAEIKALREGTTRVSFAATDGSSQNGYFMLNVNPAVTSIAISQDRLVVALNDQTKKLTATVLPAGAGNQVIDWSSDNPDICAVDYAGRLNPKMIGTCTITARTTDGSDLSCSCEVRVSDVAASVSLSQSVLNLDASDAPVTLKATVRTVSGITYNDVEWDSTDPGVATVNDKGVVTPVRPGSATIRAVALDGSNKSASCVVTVTAALSEIQLPAFASVDLGTNFTLTPTFIPSYASNQSVKWTSSDTTVASVSAAGVVAGKKAGTCVITCASTANPAIKAECTLTVNVAVTGVKLSATNITLDAGGVYMLTPTITPDNATNTSVRWTSSNTAVATVNENGRVAAVAGGNCVITCTTVNGEKTATCAVQVIEGVSGVSFPEPSITLYTSQTYTLKPTVRPATATDKTVTWSSSNTSVATVNSAGVVTAVGVGAASITVTTRDGGFKDSCTVSVISKVDVSGIGIGHTAVTVAKDGTWAVDAVVYPSNASNKTILWKSNAPKVASVDDGGLVTGLSAGTAVITATTEDGGFTARCTVTVTQSVTGVTLNVKSAKIAVGASKTLTATVAPGNATNKKVSWYSSDETIATVNGKGLVVGVKKGTCTITVITEDGQFSASATITVYTPQAGIKINSENLKLAKGATTVLTATVLPEDATDKTVLWSSSDSTICSVNDVGQIKGLKVGTAVITATTSDKKYKAQCQVTVVQLVTSVTLEYTSIQLNVGKSKTLVPTIKPASATDRRVKWSSSDKTIASVDKNGKVTALKAGTVTITCASVDKGAKTTCKVIVIQPVSEILFKESSYTVKVGKKMYLTYNVLPADATVENLQWKSSNKKVAKVNSKGRVTGIAPGKVKITVTSADGTVRAATKVIVQQGVTGITLDKTALTVAIGKTATLTPTLTPSNASVKTVVWTSSNNDVATVSKDGVVTPKAVGYAEITATTKDGGYTAVCKVNVIRGVNSVTLDQTALKIKVDEKKTLTATVLPENATDKSLKWTTTDKKVVKVTQTGVIKGIKPGTATITVTSVQSGKKATCVVTVVRPVTGVTLNKAEATLEKGATLTLRATVTPSDATNQNLKWATNNRAVATVNSQGVVTAVGVGTAVIVVKTRDGGFKDKCTVNVVVNPTSIKLNKTKLKVFTGTSARLTATLTPDDAAATVTWKSSDKTIAKVTGTGKVVGIKPGTVTITAVTINGLKASCKVKVYQSASGVSLNKTSAILGLNETLKLSATVAPKNAADKTIVYTTSNATVATVDDSGTVTGAAPGKVTITATNPRSGLKATCTVEVRIRVTGVSLNQTKVTLGQGEQLRLTAAVAPKNATLKTVTWSSSDTAVATVDETGSVTAVGGGTAVITAKSDDTGKKATCTVTVNIPATGISVPEKETTYYVGTSAPSGCSVVPAVATNKTILYTVADETIATIGKDGTVTPKANGTTTVTAKTEDGGFEKTFTIRVETKASGVELSQTAATVELGGSLKLTATVLPKTATNQAVTWKSSDETIASVDKDGNVTTHTTPGKAVITVTTVDGGKTAACTVTVTRKVSGVSLDRTSQFLKVGETVQLNATVHPDNATNKTLQWSSANTAVATVDSNGVVTAVAKGNVVITVMTEDGGYTAACVIAVTG